ncbi:MAG: succinyl-diaminopimelate desuccinylase [Campylobacterales bacterium]|nr:succinyl-diaminopimelate desuccinylase [Campylobacterales bacterium]
MELQSVDILKKLITYKTITPKEENIYQYIYSFFDGWEKIHFDRNETKNLFIYKKFGEGEHLCFAGHIDVVPPGDGWETDPFEPIEKDGKLFGRGTQDMKGGVAAFVSACKDLKEFNGTVSLLLTSDEEGDAYDGTIFVLEELKKMKMLPDMCVIAEPTCEEKFGDAIKVGRRGSINGYLTIEGFSGHAAYPEKCDNPLHNFGDFLASVAGLDLDNGDDFFAPSKLVVTDLRSGYEVTNLTPGSLKMMFNVRNSTNTTKEDLEKFVKTNLEKSNISKYQLELKQGSFPFVTKEGKYSKRLVETISKSIEEISGITPKRSTAGGTSDARFMGQFGIDVIEFGVINDTIHSPNERTTIKEIEDLEKVFINFLTNI